MRKWTVRVDDEIAACFSEFCAINGVSIQGAVEGMVGAACEYHLRADARPVEEWDQPARWAALIARARAIDAAKRRSGPR